ncbi:hypothetical protein J437_LFUL016803 [Ladona fulva]|uniref:Uncharacterized protein n=1 Tax=Ladona fulva TaxID=123851 RepID=A0A8K0NXN2_LADFU|nr:hypothetical protein J437_LFUL016803 [Ladona fulva]
MNTVLQNTDSGSGRMSMAAFYLAVFRCAHLKDEEAAVTFDSCEKLVEDKQNERFYYEIKEGLEHVLFSSRLFFFRLTGRQESAEEILPRIKLFKELNKVCQAAVFGVKANILRFFGYDAKHEALKCARLAIELDPDDLGSRRGAWYYLAGKILAEIRRTESFCEVGILLYFTCIFEY